DSSGPAECTDCLPSYHEDPEGNCVQCERTADCPAGEHCDPGSGTCQSDCPCPGGLECDPYGRCISDTAVLAQGICAAGISEGELVEPIVMLLVDRSGSMETVSGTGQPALYPSGCDPDDDPRCDIRWNVVRHVLFGNGTTDPYEGVVWSLENAVKFGFTTYTFRGSTGSNTCPHITGITRQLSSHCSNSPYSSCTSNN